MVVAQGTNNSDKLIWRSTDSGVIWTSVNWFTTESSYYQTKAVPMIMAYDGNHICSATMTTNYNNFPQYNIVISADGGSNWNQVSAPGGKIEYFDMSKSGQYIVVIYCGHDYQTKIFR